MLVRSLGLLSYVVKIVKICTVEDEEADAGSVKSGLLVELVVVAPVLLARLVFDVAAGTPTALRKASCPTLEHSNQFRSVSN